MFWVYSITAYSNTPKNIAIINNRVYIYILVIVLEFLIGKH